MNSAKSNRKRTRQALRKYTLYNPKEIEELEEFEDEEEIIPVPKRKRSNWEEEE